MSESIAWVYEAFTVFGNCSVFILRFVRLTYLIWVMKSGYGWFLRG